jgi:hypothetical protein
VHQVCAHHVDAGPDRKEIMMLKQCNKFYVLKQPKLIPDLTGWSSRNESNFRWFVEEASK